MSDWTVPRYVSRGLSSDSLDPEVNLQSFDLSCDLAEPEVFEDCSTNRSEAEAEEKYRQVASELVAKFCGLSEVTSCDQPETKVEVLSCDFLKLFPEIAASRVDRKSVSEDSQSDDTLEQKSSPEESKDKIRFHTDPEVITPENNYESRDRAEAEADVVLGWLHVWGEFVWVFGLKSNLSVILKAKQ